MDPKTLRKRQIAKRLGVSEQVLEQYLQLKRAEVVQPQQAAASDASSEAPARERRDRQRHGSQAARASRRPVDTSGNAKRR